MQATINKKRYDTKNCEVLGARDHYNNGNYAGTTYLLIAKNGQLLTYTDSNGQDMYVRDNLSAYNSNDYYNDYYYESIDSYDMTDAQATRCAELGLITI